MGPSPCCSTYVWIYKPDGTTLVYRRRSSARTAASSTRARCPMTGRYKMLVDPQGTATGSMTLTLYDVPAGRERDHHSRWRGRDRHDRADARPERARPVRRRRRPAHQPEPEPTSRSAPRPAARRASRSEAGRLDARLRHAVRHDRRLRRHEGAARERDLHDPRRPADDRRRLGDADPVRRPAGRDRLDDSGRVAASPSRWARRPARTRSSPSPARRASGSRSA